LKQHKPQDHDEGESVRITRIAGQNFAEAARSGNIRSGNRGRIRKATGADGFSLGRDREFQVGARRHVQSAGFIPESKTNDAAQSPTP
jgi:hypothetical protein